jgi:transcriptional regulator with XRE-family HTH domain
MDRDVEIGRLLREKRLERGWSAETVAELYGNAVRGEPMTANAIFNLEEGIIPKNRKRRWVLARMLDIAPAALGLEALQETRGKIPLFPLKRNQSVDVSDGKSAEVAELGLHLLFVQYPSLLQ